ncbi:zf-HC2 domain-containing protein [Saccharopolyspora sp. NFXS83]|uniref:zf-HC2 domain-containing protein n=1 Tax=Saccharopolyspora sp. NFXS83 TaxID=2993560 RepID=UPI00224B1212|nr:zf-HC2 domain-containing protein [Saccharopolyspora sp. NFXS83]MCX2733483.1 zf-HC2 domain-containing protein [Saccharopolyspora sp. NFXS83]
MTEHASEELIAGYVRGDTTISPEQEWALEGHLESCAECRVRLADVPNEQVSALVLDAWEGIAPELGHVAPAPRRRFRVVLDTWAAPAMLPWIAGALLVAVFAVLLALVSGRPDGDSPLLLFAPVVPVLGVAAAWSTGLDPMHELAVATPRAGLALVLRRTFAALVPVVPLLTGTSLLVGTSPLLWLLPSAACTALSLALGSAVGVHRATLGVAGTWLLLVGGALFVAELPATVLAWTTTPVWAGVAVVSAVVLVVRAEAFTRLAGG